MMRKVLNSVQMNGVVVIGEGAKDEAPMLYCGEKIGDGRHVVVKNGISCVLLLSLKAEGCCIGDVSLRCCLLDLPPKCCPRLAVPTAWRLILLSTLSMALPSLPRAGTGPFQ